MHTLFPRMRGYSYIINNPLPPRKGFYDNFLTSIPLPPGPARRGQKGRGALGGLRLLRRAAGAQGPAAGAEYLLGGHDLPEGSLGAADRAGRALCLVIALGYGANQGVPHKSKSQEAAAGDAKDVPGWFWRRVDAALLAPTAMNQQKFRFSLAGNRVLARAGFGFYSRIDLGITRYHFELGAGRENFCWDE